MLNIQEAAIQINKQPQKVYFFTGLEYGIKCEYLSILKNRVNGRLENYPDFESVFSAFKQKSLIPQTPSVYVVRYDKTFISNLDDKLATKLLRLNIVGTVVGIYQDDKDEVKLDKYFPQNVVKLNMLTHQVLSKHLTKNYPNLTESQIQAIVEMKLDYFQSCLICNLLSTLPKTYLYEISKQDIYRTFQYESLYKLEVFRKSIARRDVKSAIHEIECYQGDLNSLFYEMLNTYLELIKCFEKSYVDSYLKPFTKYWTIEQLKQMFYLTYEQVEKLRDYSQYKIENSLIYLTLLLQYRIG